MLFDILVPSPSVITTTQTVGQSLTLQCEVTTVRGITSRVNIVWSSGGTVLRRMNDTTATTMDNSLVYTDSYTISQLSTTDEGRVIQCEGVINVNPLVTASNSTTLDVTGKSYYLTDQKWYKCTVPHIDAMIYTVLSVAMISLSTVVLNSRDW